MTLQDFEKAKVIDHKIGIDSGNLIALRRVADNAYGRPTSQPSYRLNVEGNPNLSILVDLDFIEMAIEYYEQDIKTLNEQFTALGRE